MSQKKRKDSKKIESQGFDQLSNQLSKNNFKRRLGLGQRRYRGLIFGVAILLCGLVLYFGVTIYRNRDMSTRELYRYVGRYVTSDASEFKFKWTDKNIDSLVASDSKKGTLLKDIYKKYGKGTGSELISEESEDDGFKLSYVSNHFDYQIPYQKVILSFKKIDGQFRLVDKEASLNVTRYEADWGHVFSIKEADLKQLKAGFFSPNPENYSRPKDVLDALGKPNNISFDVTGDLQTMMWFYYHPEVKERTSDEYVTFYFIKWPYMDDFRLGSYSGTVEGKEVNNRQ